MLGLTAGIGAFLGLGLVDGAEARRKRCGPCQRRRWKRCKPRALFAPCGEGGFCCTGKECCARGQACVGDACGACPTFDDNCFARPNCGYTASGAECWCYIALNGTDTTCAKFDAWTCFDCETDQDCADELGEPATCIAFPDCDGLCAAENARACVVQGCID